jgi:hypothetical protein
MREAIMARFEVHNSLLNPVLHGKPEIERDESTGKKWTLSACDEFSLLSRFFSALRFMVAVIFKSLHGALSASPGVLSKRAAASVSLYPIGEGFVMGVRSVHMGDHGLHSHFARWHVWSLINIDRRSNLTGTSGDLPDVVKIAQTFLHRFGNLSATESKGAPLKSGALNGFRASPFGTFFPGRRQVIWLLVRRTACSRS